MDINRLSTQTGLSVLHYAAYSGNQLTIPQLLARNDIDVNLPTKDGISPLLIAARRGHWDVVNAFLNHKDIKLDPASIEVLFLACQARKVDTVNLILSKHSYHDHRDQHGNTILHIMVSIAAKHKRQKSERNTSRDELYKDVFATLVDHGFDLNVQNINKLTPLHLSVHIGFEKFTECLLNKQADTQLLDKDGKPPVFYSKPGSKIQAMLQQAELASVSPAAPHQAAAGHFATMFSHPARPPSSPQHAVNPNPGSKSPRKGS